MRQANLDALTAQWQEVPAEEVPVVVAAQVARLRAELAEGPS